MKLLPSAAMNGLERIDLQRKSELSIRLSLEALQVHEDWLPVASKQHQLMQPRILGCEELDLGRNQG